MAVLMHNPASSSNNWVDRIGEKAKTVGKVIGAAKTIYDIGTKVAPYARAAASLLI